MVLLIELTIEIKAWPLFPGSKGRRGQRQEERPEMREKRKTTTRKLGGSSKWRVGGNRQDRGEGTRPGEERRGRGEMEEGKEECVPRSLPSTPFT